MAGQKSTLTLEPTDPDSVAVSCQSVESASRMAVVRVYTREGSVYTFPDMDAEAVKKVLPESGRLPTNSPSLSLVNVSVASLVIPFRVITEIYVNWERIWRAPG